MRVTERTVTQDVETTEILCEISQEEFDSTCAKVASKFVIDTLGDDLDIENIMASISMTHILADFVAQLDKVLFNKQDTNENPDKKEEK